MPTRQELVANQVGGTTEAIRKFIGADFLLYQTIEDLIDAVKITKGPAQDFCAACWTKKYPTPEVTTQALRKIERTRLMHC